MLFSLSLFLKEGATSIGGYKLFHRCFLIDLKQYAFVKGRQNLDASLVANEVVDSREKIGVPSVLCKVDLERTYDHVNRNSWISFC